MPRPRIRTTKPEWYLDDITLQLSVSARYLAQGLKDHADDEGYGNADLRSIAARIIGDVSRIGDVTEWYAELENVGYLTTYEIERDGHQKRYYHIPHFTSNQRIDKPSPSAIREHLHPKKEAAVEDQPPAADPPKPKTTSPTLMQRIWREDCDYIVGAWRVRFADVHALPEKSAHSQAGLLIKAANYSGVHPEYLLSQIPRGKCKPWPYFIRMCEITVRKKGATTIGKVVELPDAMRRTHSWQVWLERHRTQSTELSEITNALAAALNANAKPKQGG